MRVGPLKKDPHGRGGRVGEGVGGSICRVLRGSEALGGPIFGVCCVGLRLWEARFVVFYEGLRLGEAHVYVFYASGRRSGGSVSNEAMREGGSA